MKPQIPRELCYAWLPLVLWLTLAPIGVLAQTPALDRVFRQTWARADYPVAHGRATRPWLWGPQQLAAVAEPWEDGNFGVRAAAYYDKGRMEIFGGESTAADGPWTQTNGLLVTELMTGRIAIGPNIYRQHSPGSMPVAGDAGTTNPLTYAALARVASLAPGQNVGGDHTGQSVNAVLGPDGTFRPTGISRRNLPILQVYERVTSHNIPDVFWRYMTQTGPVYRDGKYMEDRVFDWVSTVGYPLTEPYWTTVSIGGKPTEIMLQAYERRVLTYNPANPSGWQVESNNAGAQYYAWRYGSTSPAPGGPLTMRKLIPPDQPRRYSGIHMPLTQVITDQASWAALWRKHTSETSPAPPAPSVDFAREFLIASFWGDKPNSCYRLNITSASTRGNSYLTVALDRQMLQGTCLTVITQPHDFAAFSKTGIPPGKYTLIIEDAQGRHPETTQVTFP